MTDWKKRGRKPGRKGQEPQSNRREQEPNEFDFSDFLHEQGIRPAVEGDRHYMQGWVNVPCPFCVGNPGNHLGWYPGSGAFTCFRCGNHSSVEVVSSLAGVSIGEALAIIQNHPYEGKRKPAEAQRVQASKVTMPALSGPLKPQHRKYLEGRRFDPDELVEIWGLCGTGPIGMFKHRIIAPIYHERKLVSYQGRDITGRAKYKYRPCPKEQEVRPYKSCLYGLDKVPYNAVVVVEGITDVWRLGPGAVATFGLKYTQSQIKLLTQFERVLIAFDNGDNIQGQEELQSRRLHVTMQEFGKETTIINLDSGDPADLQQKQADRLMRDLQLRD